MRNRKWLYLSSLVVMALDLHLYDEHAAAKVLQVLALPYSVLVPAAVIGTAYLALQYLFLGVQLVVTYDIILDDRFTFRRADELAAARERYQTARQAHAESTAAFLSDARGALARRAIALKAELAQAQEAHVLAVRHREDAEVSHADEQTVRQRRYDASRSSTLVAVATRGLKQVEEDPESVLAAIDPNDHPDVKPTYQAFKETEKALLSLHRQVPSNRRGYRMMEQAIDGFRLVPPLALALYALAKSAI